MSVFYFIGVYLLGIIFAGAWLDKVRKQTAHVQQMKAYRLLPPSFAGPMFYLFLLIELVCTVHLFIWNMSVVPAFGLTALLCIYTGAVTFNLLRGHHDISCGCGGLLENDRLHWGIVIRNLLMLALVVGLFYVHPYVDTMPWHLNIICFLIAAAVCFIIALSQEIMLFKRKWINQFDIENESMIEGEKMK
ncbi:methylamine utilization protein [Bacillus xiamenensis]|uniref:Methylamine utilization protein n=1 Tax=Bacillus xiamenensis TaxID=1178537 RepID=A0ABT4EZM2_9BACI|nr:MauE/DoxX family redox-associated membrane protein [Bacillus xiamenensis]MBG9913132.1 methylamine utilization protein [Bacillus xiamenensis]MCY9575253.1 methylamine utilization protein [Bacillus xiamenensis]